MNIRALLPLLVAVCCLPVVAETDPPSASKVEAEASLASINKWKSFEGVWEGELRYVAAPKQEWLKQKQPVRVVLHQSEIKISVRVEGKDWHDVASTYRAYQPDPLTIVIHAYGASGVWTENNVFVITRRSEDIADVFVQRVVNNWAGKPVPGEDLVYGDSRAGIVKRKPGA